MDIKPILYFIIIGGPFLMGSWDLWFFGQEFRLCGYQYSGLKIYFEGVRINISWEIGGGGTLDVSSVILGVFLHVLVLYKFIVFNSYMYITGTYLYVCFLDIWDYNQICCK